MIDEHAKAGPKSPLEPEKAAEHARKADTVGAKAASRFSTSTKRSVTKCQVPKCPKAGALGSLSAKYESGGRGAAAIGYDKTGGWSYGKYQIATRTGTMKSFLKYVEEKSPEVVRELDNAGGYKTALAGDRTFKDAWIRATQDPKFEKLQHDFIRDTHYTPLAERVRIDVGLDVRQRSPALQDVVWSTSVQHGSGSKVIQNALSCKNVKQMTDEEVIDAIYDERSKEIERVDGKTALKYFSSSSQTVQDGIKKRFEQERYCAKQMLRPTIDNTRENNDVPLLPEPLWI